MIFHRKLFILTVLVAALLVVSSCSDAQNRDKKSSSVDGATVSVNVTSRSTTVGTQTTQELDKKIEKAVTKNLSRALIVGESDESLFTDGLASTAKNDFPDNKTAKKNTVDVSYSYMASDNENETVVVADISHSVTDKDGTVTTQAGKIFFDTKGIILGYSFPDTAPTTSTTIAKAST